ncbi:hypothetical protein GCM10027567_16550 [Spongiibacter taiwanensis]
MTPKAMALARNLLSHERLPIGQIEGERTMTPTDRGWRQWPGKETISYQFINAEALNF